MKKILTAAFMALCLLVPVMAQNSENTTENTKPIWDHGDNVSNLQYVNARIFKIFEQKDAFVVYYERTGVKIDQAVIPKRWVKEHPRKLEIRTKPNSIDPYMTVIYKNGEFLKVLLTVPLRKEDPVWGFYKKGAEIPGLDKETLDIQF